MSHSSCGLWVTWALHIFPTTLPLALHFPKARNPENGSQGAPQQMGKSLSQGAPQQMGRIWVRENPNKWGEHESRSTPANGKNMSQGAPQQMGRTWVREGPCCLLTCRHVPLYICDQPCGAGLSIEQWPILKFIGDFLESHCGHP